MALTVNRAHFEANDVPAMECWLLDHGAEQSIDGRQILQVVRTCAPLLLHDGDGVGHAGQRLKGDQAMLRTKKPAPLTREQFEALPTMEQRKVIAADIVAAIDAGWMHGSVLCRVIDTVLLDVDTADEAVEAMASCHVCGIGAPMIAAARRVDRLFGEPYNLYATEYARSYLQRWFPASALAAVEATYEEDGDYVKSLRLAAGFSKRETVAVTEFKTQHAYGTPRLRAIWQNVLESEDGLFHLPAVT